MATSPSQAELAVLKHLWAAGAQSARDIQDAIAEDMGWSYSTTRTLLLRMTEKDLAERSDRDGLAIFSAKVGKVAMMGRLIRNFAERTLDLDGPIPASAFAASKLFSEAEAQELTRLLESDDDDGAES